MKTKKKWYDYLWVVSLAYLILGFFNMDEIQVFPIRIFNILFYHVLSHALEYLAGVCRGAGCIWLLQCDADIHNTWIFYDDAV